jgi:hypothetical protein
MNNQLLNGRDLDTVGFCALFEQASTKGNSDIKALLKACANGGCYERVRTISSKEQRLSSQVSFLPRILHMKPQRTPRFG